MLLKKLNILFNILFLSKTLCEILITIYEIDNTLSKCNTENITDNTIILNYITNTSTVNCSKINNSDYGIIFFEENSNNTISTKNCSCDLDSLYCKFDYLKQGVTYKIGIPKTIYLEEYVFKSIILEEKFGFEDYYVELDLSKPIYNIIDYGNEQLNNIIINFMSDLTINHLPKVENISNCQINNNNAKQMICFPLKSELPTNYQGKEISYNLSIINVCQSEENIKVNVTVNDSKSIIEYVNIYKLNNKFDKCNIIKKNQNFILSSFTNIQLTENLNNIDIGIYLISKVNNNVYYKTLCSLNNILNSNITCFVLEDLKRGIYKISMPQNVSFHQMIFNRFSLVDEINVIEYNIYQLDNINIQYYNYFYSIEPYIFRLNFTQEISNINNFGFLSTNTGKKFIGCELSNNKFSVSCKFNKDTFPIEKMEKNLKKIYYIYYWNPCGFKEKSIQVEISKSTFLKLNYIIITFLIFIYLI